MSNSDLRIDILGTEIVITTDEEPEYLDKLLVKYRQTIENVRHKSGLKDPLKVAVLTGFLLCDDLEKAGTGEAKNTAETEGLILGMISRLDKALGIDPVKASVSTAADTVKTSAPPAYAAAPAPVHDTGTDAAPIYKLENQVKNYDWGSTEWLPAFLGQKNLSRIPWAELWLGVNPMGPSRVVSDSCLLSELIDRDPPVFLGKETAAKYGALPFLFKIIAAAKPLSIQVHPNAEQAREGFERENREGIPLDAPNRNYRDPHEKSEVLCALSPFAALCGFREAEVTTTLMEFLLLNTEIGDSGLRDVLEDLVSSLKQEDENPIENFLSALFALERETLLSLGAFIKAKQPQLEKDLPEYGDEWNLCSYLAALYPGDSGIFAPLYLNIVELEPEEAIFIPAGTPHAYINGIGMELLPDSDNVLRGGLTPKHVDHAELMKILNFSEFMPEIMRPPEASATSLPTATKLPSSLHSYPAGEFVLSVMRGRETDIQYTDPGPSILLVTEGVAIVNKGVVNEGAVNKGDTITSLKKGESVFIPAGKNAVFSGVFTAYIASCKSS